MIRSVHLRLVVFCCFSLAHSGPALAQSPDTLPETLRKLFESIPTPRLDTLGLARAGLISMDGEGSVRVRPDTARIRVGVVSEAALPGEVAQQNASRMSAVLDAIKKTVGEPSLSSGSVELRTEAVTLTPIYAVHQDPQRRNPMVSGYRANNSVQITVRDLDQRSPGFLGAIIEQANKVGANEISGPEFIVFNEARPLVEARVNAIEDARTKAETYAKALNVRLGRVVAVTEGERGHRPMPMMARASSPAEATPPVETGTNQMVARVTVTWELKQD